MNNSLSHYGIKGQKWGERHYQNPDGTYTPEGKERYFGSRERNVSGITDVMEKYLPDKSDLATLPITSSLQEYALGRLGWSIETMLKNLKQNNLNAKLYGNTGESFIKTLFKSGIFLGSKSSVDLYNRARSSGMNQLDSIKYTYNANWPRIFHSNI